jgi:hypothetical protein
MIEYKVRVLKSGSQSWYQKGMLHREDGPAIILEDGTKMWWFNGQLHREDGPAVEYSWGIKSWYLDGKKLTETEWKARQENKNQINL